MSFSKSRCTPRDCDESSFINLRRARLSAERSLRKTPLLMCTFPRVDLIMLKYCGLPCNRDARLTQRSEQDGRLFCRRHFEIHFLKENLGHLTEISLKCVPGCPIDNKSVLVQAMAWRRTGDKPLLAPMMTQVSFKHQWYRSAGHQAAGMMRRCFMFQTHYADEMQKCVSLKVTLIFLHRTNLPVSLLIFKYHSG